MEKIFLVIVVIILIAVILVSLLLIKNADSKNVAIKEAKYYLINKYNFKKSDVSLEEYRSESSPTEIIFKYKGKEIKVICELEYEKFLNGAYWDERVFKIYTDDYQVERVKQLEQ